MNTTENLPAIASGGALVPVGHNPFLEAANDLGASVSGQYLKFDGNTGTYTFGKDSDELPAGVKVALNAQEFKAGWICWREGAVIDEIMVRTVEGRPPARGALTDHGPFDDDRDGWKEQYSAHFRDIEDGTEYVFKTSSGGGKTSIRNLLQDYGKTFMMHPGELAILSLGNVSFDAKDPNNKKKKLGKKFAPKFSIVGWENEADLIAKFETMAAASEDEEEGEVEPEPKAVAPRGRRNL
jgi:hypothetical protein